MKEPINKITLKDGSVRYRLVVDIGLDERGGRKQLTRTFDTRREARTARWPVRCRCCPDGISRSTRTPRYPSDMSDAEWAVTEPTLPGPAWKQGRVPSAGLPWCGRTRHSQGR